VLFLKAFELWCANRKVVEISLVVNSGEAFETAGRFVMRMGCAKVGENFVRSGLGNTNTQASG
jgi:hypothetical protein